MPWRRRSPQEPPGATSSPQGPPPQDHHTAARQRMVRDQIEARGITDADLLAAMTRVPRHAFVAEADTAADAAHADRALGIGSGQTISQPYVVAAMTQLARPSRTDGWRHASVLEIGTGSGYQAAVLAELGARVVSVERFPDLARAAEARLREHGYGPERVRVRVGDGTLGAPDAAPFDAILVTAASPSVPEPLVAQLADNGAKLVIPIGTRDAQELTVVEKRGGAVAIRTVDRVVFVPLLGEHGFPVEATPRDEATAGDEVTAGDKVTGPG